MSKVLAKNMRLALCWLLAISIALLAGCGEPGNKQTALERIREAGVLRVVTRNSPATYYQDRSGPTGLEYDLASRLADTLGVKLELITAGSIDEVYQRLAQKQDRPDLAAAGLLHSSHRLPQARFSQSYGETALQVVYNLKQQKAPRKLEDLYGRTITVVHGSVQAEWLKAAQAEHPELSFTETDEMEVPDLLREVDKGKLDITLVSGNELEMNKFSFASVRSGFELQPPYQLVWALPMGDDNSLLNEVNTFLGQIAADGTLDKLQARYYGHIGELDYVGTYTFARHLQQRLPGLEDKFRKASESSAIDWRLLAAMGYQESKWDADAVSRTGVRGIMMLTLNTARSLGISNRRDPDQSIRGGARYFVKMHKRLPESIKEPDRTWFALAAYNVGYGHLEDARRLTQAAGLDPDRWLDVKKILPRLSQKKWYSQTRYGYARGGEPVHYVNNIRRYYDILTWISQPRLEGQQVADSNHKPGIAGPAAESTGSPRL